MGPDSFTFKAKYSTADSNITTVSITIQEPAPCTTNLPISGATASGIEYTPPPTHAIDNNLGNGCANPALLSRSKTFLHFQIKGAKCVTINNISQHNFYFIPYQTKLLICQKYLKLHSAL